jgi:hypothetical protein
VVGVRPLAVPLPICLSSPTHLHYPDKPLYGGSVPCLPFFEDVESPPVRRVPRLSPCPRGNPLAHVHAPRLHPKALCRATHHVTSRRLVDDMCGILVRSLDEERPTRAFLPQPRPRSDPTHDHTDHAAAPPPRPRWRHMRACGLALTKKGKLPTTSRTRRQRRRHTTRGQASWRRTTVSYLWGSIPFAENLALSAPLPPFCWACPQKSISFASLCEEFVCLVCGERCRSVARCW